MTIANCNYTVKENQSGKASDAESIIWQLGATDREGSQKISANDSYRRDAEYAEKSLHREPGK